MSEGLIYFAKYVGDLSYVKIAYTENLYKSIRNLSNKRSTPVEVLFVIRDCCIEDEDRIHIRLGFGAHYKEDWYLWPKVQEFISNEIKKVLVPEIPKDIKELPSNFDSLSVGKRLSILRENMDFTRKELAESLNCQQLQIYNWEEKEEDIDLDTVIDISRIIGVHPHIFYTKNTRMEDRYILFK